MFKLRESTRICMIKVNKLDKTLSGPEILILSLYQIWKILIWGFFKIILLDYHVSGPRDHNRATYRSLTNEANVKQLYRYDTMFSELKHHPRYQTVLSQTDPVPKFINREYTDRTLLDQSDSFKYDARDVGGHDRYKYFRRPVVPCAQAPADVVLEPTKVFYCLENLKNSMFISGM